MVVRRTYNDVEVARDRYEAYDAVDEVEDRPVTAYTMPFSPAQVIGLIVGLFFAILGIAALAQTGLETSNIYQPHERVWSFVHSPLLALITIGFGLLMIVASVVPGALRELMALLGAIALGFGLVIVLDAADGDLNRWLGVTDRNGWLYLITGAVVLLAALLSPVFVGRTRRHRVTRRVVT
jgi:hypothetical protein